MNIKFIQSLSGPLFKKYNVQKAAVFGSYAEGVQTSTSDIDFLLELPERTTLFELAQMKTELEVSLNNKVDIVTYNSLHPRLKDRILQQQKIIYEKR